MSDSLAMNVFLRKMSIRKVGKEKLGTIPTIKFLDEDKVYSPVH
jgi:hypothetical protein